MKKVKWASIKTTIHRHRQQYGYDQREKGLGEVEEGKGGINGNGRFDVSW